MGQHPASEYPMELDTVSIIPSFFNPERAIFVSDTAIMKWGRAAKKRYIELGYAFTQIGEPFEVRVSDLPFGSSIKVHVQCCLCNQTRLAKYRDLVAAGHTVCRACRSREVSFENLIGRVFSRWSVLEFQGRSAHGICLWLVECECGVQKTISGSSLLSGESRSCGCLQREGVSKRAKSTRGKLHSMYGRVREKNPNWNPNITDDERINRRSTNMERQWRKSVFERDKYTCRACGQVGGNLNAHHLFGYVTYPTLRFEIDNGITLCKSCHETFHKWAGWGNKGKCTRQEFDEWIKTCLN